MQPSNAKCMNAEGKGIQAPANNKHHKEVAAIKKGEKGQATETKAKWGTWSLSTSYSAYRNNLCFSSVGKRERKKSDPTNKQQAK